MTAQLYQPEPHTTGWQRLWAGLCAVPTFGWRLLSGGVAIGCGLVVVVLIVLSLGVIGVSVYQLWSSGWVAQAIPAPEAPPAPPPPDPVTVQLHGPTIGVRGITYVFTAAISGDAGEAKWTVTPPTEGALRTFDQGRSAEFTCIDEGKFLIGVSVGGAAKQVAVSQITFENLNLIEESEVMEDQHPAELPPVMAQSPPPLPTVEDLAQGALDAVVSEDKAGEARIIAGSLRMFAQRLNTGLLPPDTDVPLEVEKQVQEALGARASKWQEFLLSFDGIIEDLRSRGQVTTAASTTPALFKVADVLQSAR